MPLASRVAELDVALGRDAAQAGVAHQSLLSVGLSTRPTNSSVPVGACSIGPGEGRSKMRWKGFSGSETARIVTAVVAAARVPASSTSTRARCRMRPSAFVAGPVDQLVEVVAGVEAGPRPSAISGRRARASSWCVKRGSSTMPWPVRPLDLAPLAEHRHEAQVVLGVRQPDRVRRRARSAPRRASSSTSPAPSNGLARVPSNGCAHLRVEVLGVGDARRSRRRSSDSRIRGIIPCVFSFDHALMRVERPAGRCPASAPGPGV